MYEPESSINSMIESNSKLLGLEGTEVMLHHDEGTVSLDITEYRDTDKYKKRRGDSLVVDLSEEQVARTSQIITDWLNSRTQESFDKSLGEVEGKARILGEDGIEEVDVVQLRIALDERGIFFTPNTGSDWPTQVRIPETSSGADDNIIHFKNLLLDILELSTASEGESLQDGAESKFEYDVFICHSSNDKAEIVQPLADKLRELGLSVWYDDFEISIGDDIRASIESGINDSRYGVIILSEDFIEADWAGAELSSLTAREHTEDVEKILLPLRYDVEMNVVREQTPLLASRMAPSINQENISDIAHQIQELVNNG